METDVAIITMLHYRAACDMYWRARCTVVIVNRVVYIQAKKLRDSSVGSSGRFDTIVNGVLCLAVIRVLLSDRRQVEFLH